MKKFIVKIADKTYKVEANDAEHATKLVKTLVKDNIKVGQRVKWDTTDAHGQKFAGEGIVIEAKNFAGMIVVKYDRTKYPEMYRAPYNGTAVVKESNARVIDSVKDSVNENDLEKAILKLPKDALQEIAYPGLRGPVGSPKYELQDDVINGAGFDALLKGNKSHPEAKRIIEELNDRHIKVKGVTDSFRDAASPLQTVNALLEDERAAVDAYNVALENLKGKIPDESYEAIEAIRNDENRHIENLQAVVNGNVTEKNLEDAVKNNLDVYRSAIKEAVDELQKINGKYNEQDKVLVQSVLQKAAAAIARAKSNYEKWI